MSAEDQAKMFTPEEMEFLVGMAQDVYGGPSLHRSQIFRDL
jgi:hypothetical protein